MRARLVPPIGPLVLLLAAAGCDEPANAPTPPAPAFDAAPPRETFCGTRPKLFFCADFDEHALPTPFAELATPPAIEVLPVDDAAAPSAPRVVSFRARSGPAEAFLVTPPSAATSKWNALFFVRLAPHGGDVTLARVDAASGPTLAIVVSPGGAVRLVETDARGGDEVSHATTITLAPETWSSVRWDVRDDGAGSTVRLRFGDDMVLEGEPLRHRHAGIAPRLSIGLATPSAAQVSFDTVTFAGGETE